MDTSFKVSCNWALIGGCDIQKAIQTRITQDDYFIKADLDEVVSEDHAVLLTDTEMGVPCEIQLRLFPRYKIEALTIVCSAPKVELFLGAQKEYVSTVHGEQIADERDCGGPCSFRYDIEIEKSGIVDLTLKLLSLSNELCIFGVLMYIAPNPNGITTLMPNAINLENVQKLLESSNAKLSPSAEKCKLLMQSHPAAKASSTARETSTALLDQMKQMFETKAQISNTQDNESNSLECVLKSHIDLKLRELETHLMKRLENFETQQSLKLDTILQHLQERK